MDEVEIEKTTSEPTLALARQSPVPDITLQQPEDGHIKSAVSMDNITVHVAGHATQQGASLSSLDIRPPGVLPGRSTCAFSITSLDGQRMERPDYKLGIPMGLLHGITYPVITVVFLIGSNASQMPQPPLLLFHNVLSRTMLSPHKWLVVFPILMWCSHFLRRVMEILWIYHARKPVPYSKVFISLTVRIIFSFCIGWSLNCHTHYEPPAVGFIIVGVLLFVVGEVGNCLSHIHLMRCAKRKTIALGGIFNYVSRPHYMFEILSWLGFWLTSFTLPTLMFVLMNTFVLTIRGHRRHKKYRELDMRQEKDTVYCSTRKAIIPFLF